MVSKFHLLARAIIVSNDQILLVHAKGQNHSFLPGGHHEGNESFPDTLRREMKEELGVSVDIEEYLGAIENSWVSENIENSEINHIFLVSSTTLDAKTPPESKESHIEFFWAKPNELEKNNVLPKTLHPLINQCLELKHSSQ